MKRNSRARRIAFGGLIAGLAILAGSDATHAEWPKLWRGVSSKPKAASPTAESKRRPIFSEPQPRSSADLAENRTLGRANSAQPHNRVASYEDESIVPAEPRDASDANTRADADDYENTVSLESMVALGLQQNPRLSKISFAVESARGKAIQAGLYPNPTVSLMWDELFDKTGPSGVNSLPNINQQIVTARKLRISQAAAMHEVDQASWAVMAERYSLLADIRVAYYDALALQRRVDILNQLVALADKSVEQTNQLIEAKQVARLDLVQLEVEAERLRAELESSERELPSAYKRLAAEIGVNRMAISRVAGDLAGPLPDYDLDRTQTYVLAVHPELQIAQWGVQKAQCLVKRARVELIPNLGIDTGYVRQNQNKSDDFRIGVSASLPLWNRNQGNIHSAEADLCQAMQEIGRIENDLTDRVSQSMRDYASARRRAERYRTAILPRAKETYKLSRLAYQGGQFEYLRVLEAQRAVAQANLEYIRALGDAWKAAAKISGLAIEDHWPIAPSNPADVPPAPAVVAPKP